MFPLRKHGRLCFEAPLPAKNGAHRARALKPPHGQPIKRNNLSNALKWVGSPGNGRVVDPVERAYVLVLNHASKRLV